MDLWNKYQIDKYFEYAEQKFIEEASTITERIALSYEIDYYKPPCVKARKHVRDLTGKDIIHICNIIKKEDMEYFERIGIRYSALARDVADIKEYALDNPNKIIAHEFYLSGTFTIADRESKYMDQSMSFIIIPKLEGYMGGKYRFLFKDYSSITVRWQSK